jgi:hypothetical protein
MIVDAQLQFSAAQAITAAAASTNYIDVGIARNVGVGENLFIVVTVDTAFTDASSDSTLTVALEGDSTTTFTPDGSQTLFTIPALAAAGAMYIARINPDFAANYRYMQLKYTPNNGNLTTGAVTANIVKDVQKYTSYAKGYSIS